MNKLEEWHDSRNVSQIGLHLIWCTKFRHPVLENGVDEVVKQTIGQTCADNEWAVRSIEIMPDHVHLFIQIRATNTPCDVVRILKSTSAIAVFYAFPKLKGNKFWGTGLWSRGTYYASVGLISQETIIRYIENQMKGHDSSHRMNP